MTVFFVHPSVLPDILELMPDAEAHEYKMVDGEIGMVDGGVHIVPLSRTPRLWIWTLQPPPEYGLMDAIWGILGREEVINGANGAIMPQAEYLLQL